MKLKLLIEANEYNFSRKAHSKLLKTRDSNVIAVLS